MSRGFNALCGAVTRAASARTRRDFMRRHRERVHADCRGPIHYDRVVAAPVIPKSPSPKVPF